MHLTNYAINKNS